MASILKEHKWAVFLAVLTGVIVAFPQFYFPIEQAENYQGVLLTCTDNESYYLNRIREVQDGHPSLGSPVFKDGKNDPYLQSPLSEVLVGYLGKIFLLDLNNTILLSRFFFAFIGFLAIYGFAFLISKVKLASISASLLVLLANSLFSRVGLITLLRGDSPSHSFLSFFRPIYPQVSMPFIFGFLVFFWLFFDGSTRLTTRKQWIFGIISGFILGLSFYIYPFNWTFLYVFCGVLFLISIFKKQWQWARRIFTVILGGLVVALPYFLNLYRSFLHPNFSEVSIRFGLIDTREPLLGFLMPTIFVIFLLFFPRKWKNQFVFSLALLVAPLIIINQQLITGKSMQAGHYHWYVNQPLAIVFLTIILFYCAGAIRGKYRFFKNIDLPKISAVVLIGLSLYTGIIIQTTSYRECVSELLYEQRYAPIIDWFNKNADKEEVVLADETLSQLVSIYTSLNLFNSPQARYYLSASNDRTLDLIFLFYRLGGVSGEEAGKLFLQKDERKNISRHLYHEYYKEKFGSAEAIPDEILYSIAEKYQSFVLIPIDRILRKYEVKYVIWDKKNYPQWQMDQYGFLNKVYEKGDFVIYEF